MKDYYKILGISKSASEEEIRRRWIKLMQKFHPDQKPDGVVEDERVKEINEAYQVLKHSSTRLEYDLKKAYQQRKRKGFYLPKISIPIGIFIILLILGVIYIKEFNISTHQKLIAQNQLDPITQEPKNPITQKPGNAPNTINPTTETAQRNQAEIHARQSIPDPKTESKAKMSLEAKVSGKQIDQIDNITQRPKDPETQLTQQPKDAKTQLPFDLSPLTFDHIIDPKTQQPKDAITHRRDDQINQINQIAHKAPLTPAPFSPIVMEEEVRKFLANYIERYTKKDLDGFLSLFSSGAIQNQKDRIEKIRMIYANFFNQSMEIRYYMEDIKIDIFKNPVEVKTSYEVVQILKKGGEKVLRGQIQWTLIKDHENLKIFSLDYERQKSQ
jgi:curved DNA-binding protein CbpA